MSVFRNYNPKQAGGVNANAFPRVHPIPWVPSQQNVRANPNIPSQPQRIGPYERGTWHASSASASGTLAPQMSAGCSGCGCGGGGATPTLTASDHATGHTFPSSASTKAPARVIIPRPQPRGVGSLRPSLPSSADSVNLSTGRNSFMSRDGRLR
jgi:hypothetical protein